MSRQNLESMSTESLQQSERLSRFALHSVWIGAAIAILAYVIKGFMSSEFPGITLLMAVLALAASVPVYFERKKMLDILMERSH